MGARQIALLAAAGLETVTVNARLRVAILSVGDELAGGRAGRHPRDANRPMLRALCASNGFEVTDFGILSDNREQLAEVLARAAADHDVIISTAGTSAGDEDHARGAIVDCGGRLLIAGAAIKPGKPVSFEINWPENAASRAPGQSRRRKHCFSGAWPAAAALPVR